MKSSSKGSHIRGTMFKGDLSEQCNTSDCVYVNVVIDPGNKPVNSSKQTMLRMLTFCAKPTSKL